MSQVYRHAYQQQFQLEFTISLGEGKQEEVKEPISLLEINGRTSFNIKGAIYSFSIENTFACIHV